MKTISLFLFLILAGASSHAANWVKVYDDGKEQGYIDSDIRETSKGRERVWSKWTFSEDQVQPHVKQFRSYVKLKYYNCADNSFVTKKATAYSGEQLSGHIVYVAEYPSLSHDESDVMPVRDLKAAQLQFTKIACHRHGQSVAISHSPRGTLINSVE